MFKKIIYTPTDAKAGAPLIKHIKGSLYFTHCAEQLISNVLSDGAVNLYRTVAAKNPFRMSSNRLCLALKPHDWGRVGAVECHPTIPRSG